MRPPLLSIVNVYEVEPTPAGARIRHALAISGPLARIARIVGLDRTYRRQLDAEVERVVALAAAGAEEA